ncbi:MAG: hypothetical protein QG669_315 [Patescibacteria group bacterium]|nr:hypothetical protein [Patescibacteria group bacterium]
MEKKKVIVIGAGIAGLGTAGYLAKDGYDVTIVEKNEHVGGRANIFESDGFRFDMGPSWYLMPDIFEHYFKIMGENIHDHLTLQKLSPSYRIFFKDEKKSDGTPLVVDMYSDLTKDLETFENIEKGSAEKLTDYLARSKHSYDIAKNEFMYKNYNSIFDFLTPRVAIEGSRLKVFSQMHSYVKKFFSSSIIQKIIEYQLVFLGSSPYNTPALYNIMNHIDFNMGVFYPKNGIFEVPTALKNIAEKNGALIRTNSPVKKIIIENGTACGVELVSGEILKADIVISNADMHHTETALLETKYQQYPEKYWGKKTMAHSDFILYLGVNKKIPELVHHSLIFSKDWKTNFEQIFDSPQFPTDPSLYICTPSKTDPSVAPEGMENMFVLVPIASGLEYTESDLENYKQKILTTISEQLHIQDLNEHIVFSRTFCVKDFYSTYNAYKGTALGLAHTLRQTALFRPNNFSKKVKNLYYAGAGTNPGIGMPICLISAELVYKRIKGIKSANPLEKI